METVAPANGEPLNLTVPEIESFGAGLTGSESKELLALPPLQAVSALSPRVMKKHLIRYHRVVVRA